MKLAFVGIALLVVGVGFNESRAVRAAASAASPRCTLSLAKVAAKAAVAKGATGRLLSVRVVTDGRSSKRLHFVSFTEAGGTRLSGQYEVVFTPDFKQVVSVEPTSPYRLPLSLARSDCPASFKVNARNLLAPAPEGDLAEAAVAMASKNRFDLLCTFRGIEIAKPLDGSPADINRPSGTLHYRIDLAAGKWCMGNCSSFASIAEARSDRLTLIDQAMDGGGREVLNISRIDGSLRHTAGSRNKVIDYASTYDGTCKTATFTPFPKPLF